MTAHSALYVGNTAIVQLTLTDRNDASVDGATVTLESLRARGGDAVSGVSVPLTLSDEGSGVYEATIPATAGISAGKIYEAEVKAESGSLVGQWTETLVAQERHV